MSLWYYVNKTDYSNREVFGVSKEKWTMKLG